MAIRGIGGIFFKARDPEALASWYDEHLGVARDPEGFTTFAWREIDRPDEIGQTVWAAFPEETEYFGDDVNRWMVNYRVDDLDAELERLRSEGVQLVGDPEVFDYGKFAWGLDPDGNKFELWEPAETTGFELCVPPGAAERGGPVTPICDPGKKVAATADTMSDEIIVVETVVDLPIVEVWRLWTTGDGLAEWLVEANHVELRLGGPYEWYFNADGPTGERGGEGNKVLSFSPERFLSFTWNAPPSLPHTRKLQTHVVVEFDEVDEGTRVRLSHLGFPTEEADPHEEWPETVEYFQEAWPRVLAALDAHAD